MADLTVREEYAINHAILASKNAPESRARYVRQGIALHLMTLYGTRAHRDWRDRFDGLTKEDWDKAAQYYLVTDTTGEIEVSA